MGEVNTDAPFAPEIIWFTPSDAYLDHPHDMQCEVNRASVKNGPGLIAHYQGEELEESLGNKIWISIWRSLEHHRDIMEHEAYTDLVLPMLEAMEGSTHPAQVLINNLYEFERAVSAPITQFVYITLRPLHDRGFELFPLIEKLKKEMESLPGCLAMSWGPSVEKDTLEIGVMGWRSIEDRDRALNGPLQSMLSSIREISSIHIRDAILTRTF